MIVGWLPVLLLAHPLAGRLAGADHSPPSAVMPVGAQSTEVTLLQERGAGARSDAVVVYARPGGLTRADTDRIAADQRRVAADAVPGTMSAFPVVRSPDGSAALYRVAVVDGQEKATVSALRATVHDASVRDTSAHDTSAHDTSAHGAGGLAVAVTGSAGLTADADEALAGVDTTLLAGTAVVVVVLLLVTYRSPVLWLLPLAAVGAALELAKAAVYLYGQAGGALSGLGTAILTVLVFGCGTDYALLLVARYREELRRHTDRHAAMGRALARTWGAVAASAATVVAAMLCLTAARIGQTRSLGPTLALGVGCAMLAMLTLLPALLVVCGRWVFWPSLRRGGADAAEAGPWWRVAAAVGRRPRRTLLAVLAVLVAMTGGLVSTRIDVDPLHQFTGTPESVAGQRLIGAHFSPGLAAPTVVLVPPPDAGSATAVAAATDGVASVRPGDRLGGHDVLQVVLDSDPYGERAFATVTSLRQRLADRLRDRALVGGPTARQLDRRQAGRRDDAVVAPLILAVIALVLGLLLRAVIAPAVLVASVVLSFAAAVGVSAPAFRWLFGFAGMNVEIPLYAFLFLVALGVDYTIFLMHRVREETATVGTVEGMRRGLAVTGGVITSAGLVLAGTFAVLMVLPVTHLAEVGFAVATGVLLDTFVVRSVLVPALVYGLGARIWWPSRHGPPGPNGVRRHRAR
jgi:RND superfamily putative drug exporter